MTPLVRSSKQKPAGLVNREFALCDGCLQSFHVFSFVTAAQITRVSELVNKRRRQGNALSEADATALRSVTEESLASPFDWFNLE